jgi:putative heme-binding domain-containing protein
LPGTDVERAKLANPYELGQGPEQDRDQNLEARARSYLHVNCAVCHVAAGGGNARMELGIRTPREKLELIEARPLHASFGIANAMLVAPGSPERSVLVHRLASRGQGQMPPLWSNQVDAAAVTLFREWIASLPPSRPVVREWTLAELRPRLSELTADRAAGAGEKVFREIGCAQCHKIGDEGGAVGPDLSDVGKRLLPAELLESLVEPSAKIDDAWANWLVQTVDGQVHSGRIDRQDEKVVVLRSGSALDVFVEIPAHQIEVRQKSDQSNMPAGIVNVLHDHEILDLLAYLLAQRGR